MNTFTHGTQILIKLDIDLVDSSNNDLVACFVVSDSDVWGNTSATFQLFYVNGGKLEPTDWFSRGEFRDMIKEGKQTLNGLKINW